MVSLGRQAGLLKVPSSRVTNVLRFWSFWSIVVLFGGVCERERERGTIGQGNVEDRRRTDVGGVFQNRHETSAPTCTKEHLPFSNQRIAIDHISRINTTSDHTTLISDHSRDSCLQDNGRETSSTTLYST